MLGRTAIRQALHHELGVKASQVARMEGVDLRNVRRQLSGSSGQAWWSRSPAERRIAISEATICLAKWEQQNAD